MFERFSTEARGVLVAAQEQARSLGHEWVGTEHLLLGVAAQVNGPAAEALAEVGLDLATLRRAVVETVGANDAAGGPTALRAEDEVALRSVGIDMNVVRAKVEEVFGRGALDQPLPTVRQRRRWLRRRRGGCRHPRTRGPHRPFAPKAKKSLELALRESIALRHDRIGPEHVLLGVLRIRDCLAAMILVSRGVRLDDLRSRVLAHIGRGSR